MPATLDSPPPSAPPSPNAAPEKPVINAPPDFDAAFPDDGLDSPPEPPSKAPESPTKPDKEPAKPDAPKPDTKSPEAKPDAPEPDQEFDPPKVGKPSDLRSFAMRMGQRAKKAEVELGKIREEITRIKSTPPKTEDNTAVVQELAASKKQIEELTNQLKSVGYQYDPDFKKNFTEPRQKAVAKAYGQMKEYVVLMENPEDPDNPKQRPATPKDFDQVFFQPTRSAAKGMAKKLFGDDADDIMRFRDQIADLYEKEAEAQSEWSKTASEKETRTKAEQQQRERAMVNLFDQARDFHAKKNPDKFLPRDGDTRGNELLEKGRAFAATVFGGNDGLNPVQIAQRDAMAFNRLSNYPRLVDDNNRDKAELVEANKLIASLRSSGPGKPTPAGVGKVESDNLSAEEAFEKMVK